MSDESLRLVGTLIIYQGHSDFQKTVLSARETDGQHCVHSGEKMRTRKIAK